MHAYIIFILAEIYLHFFFSFIFHHHGRIYRVSVAFFSLPLEIAAGTQFSHHFVYFSVCLCFLSPSLSHSAVRFLTHSCKQAKIYIRTIQANSLGVNCSRSFFFLALTCTPSRSHSVFAEMVFGVNNLCMRMHVYGWTTFWESLNFHIMPMSTKTNTDTDRHRVANSNICRRYKEKSLGVGGGLFTRCVRDYDIQENNMAQR